MKEIYALRELLISETEEANMLAEFIGLLGLQDLYAQWSRPRFADLKRNRKKNK